MPRTLPGPRIRSAAPRRPAPKPALRADRVQTRTTPIYRAIEEKIREIIAEQELEPGDRVPSERTLADELRANRMTVRKAMDRLDLLDDPRFARLADRAAHGDTINGIVAEWTATLDARAIEERCVAHDVPVATAYTSADIFADPHFDARDDLVTVDDPVIGPIRQQAPFPRRVGETLDT